MKLMSRIRIALRIIFSSDIEDMTGTTDIEMEGDGCFLCFDSDKDAFDVYIGDVIKVGLMTSGVSKDEAEAGAKRWREHIDKQAQKEKASLHRGKESLYRDYVKNEILPWENGNLALYWEPTEYKDAAIKCLQEYANEHAATKRIIVLSTQDELENLEEILKAEKDSQIFLVLDTVVGEYEDTCPLYDRYGREKTAELLQSFHTLGIAY